MCELDVLATRDGTLVVIHDESVDRTTDGRGAVSDLTLAEIRQLDAGAKFNERFRGERIPTLDEVMKAVSGMVGLNIEIKESGLERKVCELLRSHQMLTSSMVSSFDWKALEKIRALDPEIRLGLLSEKDPDILIDGATAMRAFSVNPRLDKVNAAFCDKAHARGLKVLVWTVDSPEAMQILISFGVDGIITNYPVRLRDLMAGQ